MENASKALIMAGGVLIGVLILSLAAYLFMDFGSTAARINAKNQEQQLVEFNSKFTSFEQLKDDETGKWKIDIYDIITIAGYAKENNEYYEGIDDEQIDINIIGEYTKIQNNLYNDNSYNSSYYQNLIEHYRTDAIFEYSGATYNNRGKVKTVNFTKIN